MSDLAVQDARELTARIVVAVKVVAELISAAYAGRVWVALGYPSWAAYFAAEIAPHGGLALPREERLQVARGWREQSMPNRAIAVALGVSEGTVRTVLAEVAAPAVVVGEDGRCHPTAVAALPVAKVGTSERVLLALARAGAEGLTVHEVTRRLHLHHGKASGALSRLHRQGRVERLALYRDGCAVYLVGPA